MTDEQPVSHRCKKLQSAQALPSTMTMPTARPMVQPEAQRVGTLLRRKSLTCACLFNRRRQCQCGSCSCSTANAPRRLPALARLAACLRALSTA